MFEDLQNLATSTYYLVVKLLFLAVTLGKYNLLFLGQVDKMLY